MTETDWFAATDPREMIAFAQHLTSRRKLRLFACACCRQALNPFVPAMVSRALTATEAFADGKIGSAPLEGVREVVARTSRAVDRDGGLCGSRYFSDVLGACLSACCQFVDAAELAQDAAHWSASAVGDGPMREVRVIRPADRPPEYFAELAAQTVLFRDIVGNPFAPCGLEPEWLTDTVVGVAKSIYDEYTFDRLPILADALQDAGCESDDILGHCRSAREHIRGCWVVDLLLERM